jgi:hypothetical protein
MSLGRRLEIATEIGRLGRELEFLAASAELRDKAAKRAAEAEIERVYLRCGLAALDGLEIDGSPASAESLFASGPEDLTREVLQAIQAEWGLSEADRKN